jgi:hypothetical protein
MTTLDITAAPHGIGFWTQVHDGGVNLRLATDSVQRIDAAQGGGGLRDQHRIRAASGQDHPG